MKSGTLSKGFEAFGGAEYGDGSGCCSWEMALIARNQEGLPGGCHLQEGEIVRIGQGHREWVSNHGDPALVEKLQERLDFLGRQAEPSPGQHLRVFRQEPLVDAHLRRAIDDEIQQAPTETGGSEKSGDKDIGVKHDSPHPERCS